MKLTLTLQPIPKQRDDDLPYTCKQEVRMAKWPYVRLCGNEAIGLVPIEVADYFKLDRRAICQEHTDELTKGVAEGSGLGRYLRNEGKS